jgi:flagellar motor protein MotB
MGPQLQRAAASGGGIEAQSTAMLCQALLSRATALAHRGRLDSAELVLSAMPAHTPRALDLMARIRAQQGRFADAGKLWAEAARLDPNNPAYEQGRRRAEQMSSAPWRRRSRPLLVVTCVLLLLVPAAAGLRGLRVRRPVESPRTAAAAPPAAVVSAEPPVAVSVPGVTATRDGQKLVLQFDAGVFAAGVQLSPEGSQLLAAVARQLEPRWSGLALGITGYSDDLPLKRRASFRDNEALAIGRADAAIRRMAAASRIPPSAWSIRRRMEAKCVQPCTTDGDRKKSRTVVISIAPAREPL